MNLVKLGYAEADMPDYFLKPTAEEQAAFNASQAQAGTPREAPLPEAGTIAGTIAGIADTAGIAGRAGLPQAPGTGLPIGLVREAVTASASLPASSLPASSLPASFDERQVR